ncbi:uncharacterized protein LAESUDRAFT_756466 [Laetiporus sulphureus 93-53]|uniref:Autophagy-related protein 2 n=1 Tax=Laetiporus sulphureus 93-53 TaxID=1314785 RepID=A0A165FWN5_9APHY|nr:uncharacterized protein LAESUDRAFT_756466 [Laetiporus sulphureus 93-53]KZT09510.1 hypothetical protein LAESUDRAFT_756466 [Laetiporus sulphureus 93-53]
MSSWWSSWLPSLSIPSIDLSLPTGIQRRFISFALKRSLGHFLQPGQLDVQQIDSQIGSGYVQIRDLELNNDAINALLVGLPLELRDGSIEKVTARISWPNPLTSTVGMTLESLHLTFHVSSSPRAGTPLTPVDLSESVASVAESFIHEELTPNEEATLRESFHPDLGSPTEISMDNLPGGLDPFVTDMGPPSGEMEPQGVSLFATLIERLLARFAFDAVDTRITLVHPGHASFTLVVPEVRYGAENRNEDNLISGNANLTSMRGEARSVSISGLHVTTRCLRPPSTQDETPESPTTSIGHETLHHSTSSLATASEAPSSPDSDSSDMDEDTQMLMSQSIAVFPPRPASPSSSVASSLYQSAMSAASSAVQPQPSSSQDNANSRPQSSTPTSTARRPTHNVEDETTYKDRHSPGHLKPQTINEMHDETILSLASEPIVVRVTTPLPTGSPELGSHTMSPTAKVHIRSTDKSEEPFRVEIMIGVIAAALRARHIRGILDIARVFSSDAPASTTTDMPNSDTRTLPSMEAELRVRGTILLLLPASTTHVGFVDLLTEFFARPLIPPHLPHGFFRVHLDDLKASLSIRSAPPVGSKSSSTRTRKHAPTTASRPMISMTLTLSEISVFTFVLAAGTTPPNLAQTTIKHFAHPILITDPHLPSQYPPPSSSTSAMQGPVLPAFDVIDWTDSAHQSTTAKLSLWRIRGSQHRSPPLRTQQTHERLPFVEPQSSPRRKSTEVPVSFSSDGLHSMPSPSSSLFTKPGMSRSPGKNNDIGQHSHEAAITVKVHTLQSPPSISTSSRRQRYDQGRMSIQVKFEPLHVFLDLAPLLDKPQQGRSEAMLFLEEIAAPDEMDHNEQSPDQRNNAGDDQSTDEEDEHTPPATPRARASVGLHTLESERERERRRLERLVLEDLDLGFDYRQEVPQAASAQAASKVRFWRKRRPRGRQPERSEVIVKFPAIRVEIRGPPPRNHEPRSGAVVIDVHDLRLSLGRPLQNDQSGQTQFRPVELDSDGINRAADDLNDVLLCADWGRALIAYAPRSGSTAHSILSFSPLPAEGTQEGDVCFGAETPHAEIVEKHSRPHFRLLRPAATARPPSISAVALALDIPSVHVELRKPILDGLQLWADDLTQLVEAVLEDSTSYEIDTDVAESKDASLIGSHFFARSRSAGSEKSGAESDFANAPSNTEVTALKETAIKITVSRATISLFLPRHSEGTGVTRPFVVSASDVDALVELKPEGKDETVLTIGVMDLSVVDYDKSNSPLSIMCRTPMRTLSATRPAVKVRFAALVIPETLSKESRIKVTVWGITINLSTDLDWASDVGSFVKTPPGAFESVVPTERTRVSVKIINSAIRATAPNHPGALIHSIEEFDFSTVIVGNLSEMSFQLRLPGASLFLVDNLAAVSERPEFGANPQVGVQSSGFAFWKGAGYALLAEVADLSMSYARDDSSTPSDIRITIDHCDARLHLCADTMTALAAFVSDISAAFAEPDVSREPSMNKRKAPMKLSESTSPSRGLLSSLDEEAFRRLPEVGSAADMIEDDLPTNANYLDESFGAAAGLRELDDEEFNESATGQEGSYGVAGGGSQQFGRAFYTRNETIKMLRPERLRIIEHHFDTITPDSADGSSSYEETTLRVRLHDCDVTLFLYDGYDWARTRRIIEEEQKEMRRKLAKIRQLVASGQIPDPSIEETNTLLFNSVYIGLEHNVDELEPSALIAAIDEELNEDAETATQSSWQSLKPQSTTSPGKSNPRVARSRRKRLSRSKGPSIEFRLMGVDAEVDRYKQDSEFTSRTLVTVRDVEILDHIKTSTWRKFLTALLTDPRGNIRETGSNMVRVELRTVHPVPSDPSEEARLRAKILPLRLHVDQDALDFLKKFFSFKDPDSTLTASTEPAEEIFFQQAEVFPVDIKLDYKPRRVDYRALRDGRTIELMNFFHFDGAEMTLRHITLTGITGWPRFFDMLNDLWTPDVKATQLVDVISGVSPIRSVVNVGSGVADLVLLPIAQYRKDGRVVRGLQKGTTAFMQSTAMEAIKLGARLATGTQVILEQAEHVIGGQFKDPVMAEAMQTSPFMDELGEELQSEDAGDLISRYAEQPQNVKEGVQSAYKSLKQNFNSAAQTILAVPMEVYERSGNEGPVRAVVRAVPIAVLKPMIGASEAVSKALLGLHNTLDPNIRQENEAKYKQR